MAKELGDFAILYVFSAYLWGALALAAVVAVGSVLRRRALAQRFAELLVEPEPPPAADVVEMMREVAAAIQAAQLDLQAYPAWSDAERAVKEAQVRAELERVDALYGRLGALRPATTATYSPVVARLHTLAAQRGLVRAPPRA
jgi:cob(I)alamin adenosyltransferase